MCSSDLWRLRDSNISADFPTSAQKAIWFLQEEGGPGVDGVIAVNLSAAQAFLEDTGPLKLSSLSRELTAETFPAVISTLVEAKVNKTNPKAILGELLDAFMAQLDDPAEKISLASTALDEIHKKQILLYHRDSTVQDWLDSMQLTGDLPELSSIEHDFFMPIFTNIGGNKTDRYMKTELTHDTHIFEDGSMVATVTVARTHTFTPATLSWLKSTLASYGFTAWNSGLTNAWERRQPHGYFSMFPKALASSKRPAFYATKCSSITIHSKIFLITTSTKRYSPEKLAASPFNSPCPGISTATFLSTILTSLNSPASKTSRLKKPSPHLTTCCFLLTLWPRMPAKTPTIF